MKLLFVSSRDIILPLAVCLSICILPMHARATPPSEAKNRIIFQQPVLAGIEGNFHVPLAEHKYPSDQPFNLILWQSNPGRPDGELVPTSWRAGDMTGFYPTEPLDRHQSAFRDAAGASTVQVEGGTVGVYLNSNDLPNGSTGEKMMITPAFMFRGEKIYPFVGPLSSISNSLELQIPVAEDTNRSGNFTYAVSDFVFVDRQSNLRITYGIALFHHNPREEKPMTQERLRKTEVGVYDQASKTFEIGNPAVSNSRVVTMSPGSAMFQHQPWRGWRAFDFAITTQNFATALHSLKEKNPAFTGSLNPSDYSLVGWHLNAEMKFSSGPAQLGWSMQSAQISIN